MGGLAHVFESQGIATTQISLIREHTMIIKPPRALWVSFDLGRPMGVPNDPDFQRSVIRHALSLFTAEKGPVLEDYPVDAPDAGQEVIPVACPVNFGTVSAAATDTDRLLETFSAEMDQMLNWYTLAIEHRHRTTVGLSGMDPARAADYLKTFIKEKTGDTGTQPDPEITREASGDNDPADAHSLADTLRLAAEDIKACYFEALSAQPGQPTDSKTLADWFWKETSAAKVINEIRKICLKDTSGKLGLLGKLLLVPRSQMHRFENKA